MTLVVALAAPLCVVPATANDAAPSTSAAGAEHSTEEAAALEKAEDSGAPVEVVSQRTETSQLFANPDGGFTQDTYVVPQWVRQNNKLVDIDPTLRKGSDGSLVTRATEVGVKFSGGGSGPLVTVTRDGRSMSWSWPKPLPVPEVELNEATYRDVMPGVDLKLRAGSGGFGQLFVVKDTAAAANPDLKSLRLTLDADGVEVSTDKHGNLKAVNPAGQELFTASPPRMWDSGKGKGLPALRSAAVAPPSDEFEAGNGAKEATVPVTVAEQTLALTPDQELLTGKDTNYPVYIDPSVSGSREAWTIAYKRYPTSSYYNGKNWHNSDGSVGTSLARIGYENHTNGTARSFFRMDSNNLWNTNKVISKSIFRIKNSWSWSCSNRTAEVWLTGSISSSTTWNHQPSWARKLDSVNDSKGYNSSCPAGNLAFDVTSAAKESVTKRWNNITLGLRAASETDVYAWKKFDIKTAVLSTTYNTVPDRPSGLYTSPSSGSNCGSTTPYTVIGNTDVTLAAKVSDRDGGTVKARFLLWPTGHGGAENEINQTVSAASGTVAKLKATKAALAKLLTDAGVTGTGTFSWQVRAEDGALVSAWSTQCHFSFDATRPSNPPGVASTQFPDGSGGWPYNTASVRSQGTFTFTSGGIADVTKYEYWTSWDSTRRTATPSSAGGSVSVELTPTVMGANQVYVKSYDKAQNSSDTAVYLLYANGPKTPDKPGDINGDGNADLWAIDEDGTLRRFYGSGDGKLAEAYANASNENWTSARITHRGDWTDDGYEDLIALRNDSTLDTNRLWIQPNNGYGYACTACTHGSTRQELTVYDPANNHWKDGAKQILGIGDVDGGMDTDGDGTEDVPGYPDLLVNDGEFIWLYYGNRDRRLDSDREPVLLAGPDDPISADGSAINEVTLGAPGDWNGDGLADLVVRYERSDIGGTLWVFHAGQNEFGNYDISLQQRTKIGWNWGSNTVPLFTLTPDADHSGNPLDFWCTTPGSGLLRFLGNHEADTGHTTYKEASTDFEGFQAVS
ncbi:VCBS repeat-containing protein [Streptomyces poriticola]|uniref:VCBS repeat-containing protein n=1 Tax=Streptomyces poriticola TaxID=3120506 RepID=UPI002FCE46F0